MSRIGKKPIVIPAGTQVTVSPENVVTTTGPLGTLTQAVDPKLELKIEGVELQVINNQVNDNDANSKHGLYRSLLANMITGVSEGFTIVQELVGVGYKAVATEQVLELSLGFSHSLFIDLAPEIKVETITERGKNPTIILKSHDKQLLGMVASKIRSYRKPEPYKGKGIRFKGEIVRRKAGKTASSK
ncbi:MAG: 50S ribosomal protein L6 [Bacteroidales bacterium]|jgi:large subunit ribosomal protein L6|nr:50S ribosomal protein L6 [Bacteroidales bacterium]